MKLKTFGSYTRYIGLLVFFILSVVTMANAFGFLGFGNTTSWKEEVLLHDGSKIIVKRWLKHGGWIEPGQGPGIKEEFFSFRMPGTRQKITWKDEYREELRGSNFILFALDIINSTPYIVASPAGCLAYNWWGRPNPPYVFFRFEKGMWKRIQLSELPSAINSANLIVDLPNDEKDIERLGFVSAEMVKKFNSSLQHPEFKTIARTPLKGVGCPDWSSPRYTSPKAPFPMSSKVKGTEN